MRKGKKILFVILFSLLFLSRGLVSRAADPAMILTWSAKSLAPRDYTGRILPGSSSPIRLRAAIINSNGTLADLSDETIQWYINGQITKTGKGLTVLDILAPSLSGGSLKARAQITNFQNSFIAKTITIPVASPQVVIETPFPGLAFSQSSIRLIAHPYYFSANTTNDLSFQWLINGLAPSTVDDPEVLTISVNPKTSHGTPVSVKLTAVNNADQFEAGVTTIPLVYQ